MIACLPCFAQRIGTYDRFNSQQFSQSQGVICLLNGVNVTNANIWGGTISNGIFVGTISFPVGPVFTNALDANQFSYDTKLHMVFGAKITNASLYGTVTLPVAGNKLSIKEGSNAAMGVATLTSGAAGVANTLVTGATRIFLTPQSNTSIGHVFVNGITNGVGFGIKSDSAFDSAPVAWLLIEPAP